MWRAVTAMMAAGDTDELVTLPGIRRGGEGRHKVTRKQDGCQRLCSQSPEQLYVTTAEAARHGT